MAVTKRTAVGAITANITRKITKKIMLFFVLTFPILATNIADYIIRLKHAVLARATHSSINSPFATIKDSL